MLLWFLRFSIARNSIKIFIKKKSTDISIKWFQGFVSQKEEIEEGMFKK
jgi:hypothetical protein